MTIIMLLLLMLLMMMHILMDLERIGFVLVVPTGSPRDTRVQHRKAQGNKITIYEWKRNKGISHSIFSESDVRRGGGGSTAP